MNFDDTSYVNLTLPKYNELYDKAKNNKEGFIKIVDDLFKELEERESGDSYIYDCNGNNIGMDTGYAFEGIEFFIKELKHKLNN